MEKEEIVREKGRIIYESFLTISYIKNKEIREEMEAIIACSGVNRKR